MLSVQNCSRETLATPVARLPCCHCFCNECIIRHFSYKLECPTCRAKAGKRSINGDSTLDAIINAFLELAEHKIELSQLMVDKKTHEFLLTDGGPMWWMQGMEDAVFKSPATQSAIVHTISRKHSDKMRSLCGATDQNCPTPSTSVSSPSMHQTIRRIVDDMAGTLVVETRKDECPADRGVKKLRRSKLKQITKDINGDGAKERPPPFADDTLPRRIPTRLQPWNCLACTFKNKGSDNKCEMCRASRGHGQSLPASQQRAELCPVTAAPKVGTAVTGRRGRKRRL